MNCVRAKKLPGAYGRLPRIRRSILFFIRAKVVRVESLNELRALTRVDLTGKIAFVDHVMERAKDGGGYSAASRIRKCSHYAAAERGALATIIRSAHARSNRFRNCFSWSP